MFLPALLLSWGVACVTGVAPNRARCEHLVCETKEVCTDGKVLLGELGREVLGQRCGACCFPNGWLCASWLAQGSKAQLNVMPLNTIITLSLFSRLSLLWPPSSVGSRKITLSIYLYSTS